MRFNSFDYLFFFLGVVGVFFALPPRARRWWLLGASLFFYMYWSPIFILLILYSTTIDYFVALRLERTESPGARRRLLALSYITNFGALFVFKYYNFFMDSWATLAHGIGLGFTPPLLRLVLPVGISFYTFEALSYTTDVYRRKYPAEHGYPKLLLFIVFFPKLIAGPIERAWHLMPQFEFRARFEYSRVREGLAKILWGLFKKIVVADRLGLYVDAVYNNADRHVGSTLIFATLCFAFQIYCDFSAYSDIALGTAQVMGVELLRNFRRPYLATSFSDFWARWHISLSTWFRDYVYIPLGGNRGGFWSTNQNIFTVFLISGIWHGARWTFVLWGIFHGILLLAQNIWNRYVPTVVPESAAKRWLCRLGVFPVVCLTWVLFRANSVHDAAHIYHEMLTHFDRAHFFYGNLKNIAYGLVGMACLVGAEFLMECGAYPALWRPRFKPLRWAAYAALPVLIILIGVFDGGQFIYFQF
jgi:D-alanyl-lipoteichoic acid acyltransferase DltB (MBOAT superfamily)